MQRPTHTGNRHLRAVRRQIDPPRPPRRPWRAAFFAVLAGAVLLAGGAFVWRTVPVEIPDTVAVRHGTVEVSTETDALVVRSEQVHMAPAGGAVRRLAQEGQRVRAGSPVAGLGTAEVQARASGILSYQVDGLEGLLDPASAAQWEPGWFRSLPAPSFRIASQEQVQQGEPLFKVVDNFSQSLLAMVPLAQLPPLSEGAGVKIRFPGYGGAVSEGSIARLSRDGTDALLYLAAPLFPEGLGAVRKARVELIFNAFAGNVVPRSAVDVRGGQQGVWVLEGTRPVFLPAMVVGGNAREVVLEASLPPGTRVVRIAPSHMD